MRGEETSVALTDRPQKAGPPDGSNGQGPPSPAPRPYNWRATVGLIVGIVVVAGAMGVFMRVIPTPFTQPAPTSAPTARPTAQPAPAPVTPAAATVAPTTAALAAPTPAATDFVRNQPATAAPAAQPATVVAVAQSTSAPTSAPTAVPTPISAPTVVGMTVPTAVPTATEQSTDAVATAADPSLQAEVLAAYSHYWQVLDDAFANLDGSQLSQVTDGAELLAAQTYIEQLRSQGKAGLGTADHSITLVSATPGDAVIHDKVIDHSIYVDPETRGPLPPDQQASNPDPEINGTYYLKNIDGVWKVVGEA